MWIKKAIRQRTKQLRKAIDEHRAHEFLIETEAFESSQGNRAYILTIAIGGPTERIYIDKYKQVSYYHSWGASKQGHTRTRVELPKELADVWLELVEEEKI